MRPARPLFGAGHYRLCFKYKLKAIMPCVTEEWSGHARLQPVLHSFLLCWVHYFSDFPFRLQQWQNDDNDKRQQSTGQLQLGGEPCILLQCTCTTTYQVTTHVKHLIESICSYKQATCSGKNFEKIFFVIEAKSMKAVKFIALENFLLCGTCTSALHIVNI